MKDLLYIYFFIFELLKKCFTWVGTLVTDLVLCLVMIVGSSGEVWETVCERGLGVVSTSQRTEDCDN